MTQTQALAILKTGANVFLTGEPGSGKTHVINEYVAYLRAHEIEPAITASTGIAATHIGGFTIHSWCGIGIKKQLEKRDLEKIASGYIKKRVGRARILIIDEISMLLPGTLAMVDVVCRKIKGSAASFGGLQIVLVGDFFQLPPVVRYGENNPQGSLIKESSARFAYDSPAWASADLTVCYLGEQYRQDDANFLEVLTAIRCDRFENRHLCHIKKRKIQRHLAPSYAPKLFSHNVDVDRVNEEMLVKLPGEAKVFLMLSKGPRPIVDALKRGCLSPEKLSLKTGAAVMFTKNNLKGGFVNGTLGVIEGFDKTSGSPIVKTRNGRKILAELMDWALEENGVTRAQITQLPLRLAWAITVHKSQGMSMDEAVMDLSDVFEFGQGYVALSRVRRLTGLHILGWNDKAFLVHPEVLAMDTKFRTQSDKTMQTFSGMAENKIVIMHEQFIHSCGGKIVSGSRIGISQTICKNRNAQGERRWERTLALIQSGKTLADVAKMRSRTEGTILEHLESLRALNKLSVQDIAHLSHGFEQEITKINDAFRELNTDKLSPVFEKFGGVYSYEKLRIARLMLNKEFVQKIPVPTGFIKIMEEYPSAYLPWDKTQDEKLRELFLKCSPVAGLARTFNRTRGAIRSRLAKLGLITKI